ncbi:maleylacetate reductase [Streptomyces kunmingensis]|uniref:Maleylacetate reductase n=1 Tax=Streptomyces kunmingensis TaxID=68225 RepID=A0ABU6C4H2_9ACTN|nr:maleylacetate reductase [Streptomyces kunmingensis]MEB3959621.1 maleylacetate reductase [Streptomyces kunmingensis]
MGTKLDFAYRALPMRVRFGVGSVAMLGEELAALGLERVLVLSTPGQHDKAGKIAEALGDRAAGLHPGAQMHVPTDVVQRARAVASHLRVDGYVAVGGGSTVGLAKALALESGLPIVAVPTTYAGSEMTPVWGLTENGEKRTGRDDRVLPKSVIYDPELSSRLPSNLSITSGMNAMAHAVEALYAPDNSPIISLMAEEGVRAIAQGMPRVAAEPADEEGRTAMLYGAWLCGACLGATTMSLHHKLCHILGGTFGLPHADVHAVVLPHVVAFNTPAAPATAAALKRALDTEAPARTLYELSRSAGAATSLHELGLGEVDLDLAVELATRNPYANPRPVTPQAVRAILTAALIGSPPNDARI